MRSAAVALLLAAASGLQVDVRVPSVCRLTPHARASPIVLGFFDGLAAAFENDDSLGEREEAGLKNRLQPQTITWKGPEPEGAAAIFQKQVVKEQQVMPGTSLMEVAEQAGIPIEYSCMQGTCHLCDVKVDGNDIPACTAVCPKKDITIEYREPKESVLYAKEKLKEEAAARRALNKAKKKKGVVAPTKKPAAAPANPLSGLSNPFDGFVAPTNPFEGLVPPSNPFGAKPQEEVPPPAPEPVVEEKKGGWPFG